MYPISDTLKQLFLNGNKKCCKLTLNNASTENFVITEADILSDSLTIDRYCSSGNKIEVGSAIAAELTLTLLNNDGKFNDITFEGSEVSLEIGIDGVEDSYIPCGKFTIDEPPRSLQHIKLRALDFMMLFDRKVNANEIQEIDTIENLLVKCCEVCNVDLWDEVAIKSLPNCDQTIKVPAADITYRQIVQWIAQLTGTCAFMDWDGKLRLSWFKSSGVVLDPTNRYIGGTLDENNITIKGVCIKTQNTVVTTEDSVNPVVIESNQLLYSDDETYLEAIANNIATGIGALTYRSFQCNTIPMPFLYPLDIVSYEMKVEEETVVIPTVITNHNFGLNKASALSAVGETATQSGYSSVKGLSKAEIDAAIRDAMAGVDAKAEHIHIKYSQYETGVDINGKAAMTDKPDANTEYLGTCATNSTSPPNTPSSYKWVKIRGADGKTPVKDVDYFDGKDGGTLQVKYINSATVPTITSNDVSSWSDEVPTPEKGKRTYMTQKLSTETNWSTPIQISAEDGTTPTVTINSNGYWVINGEATTVKAQGTNGKTPNITVGDNGNWFVDGVDTNTKAQGAQGKDGADIEYVYYRSSSSQTPSKPSYNGTTLSDGWTASPQGITETYKYEYVSVRTKPAGSTSWGKFSTPVIWSKWGEKGTDGDGVEYKYYLKNDATKPTYSASDKNWTDEPMGVSASNMYEYVVQITHHGDGNTTPSQVALWSKWGETGDDGRGVSKVVTEYYLSTSETTQTDGSWSEDAPEWVDGRYLWTRLVTYYTDGTNTPSNPVVDASWKKTSVVDAASKELNETLANALGLHVTEYTVGSSKISYYHSNSSLTNSKSGDTILVFNSSGFGVCKTGWNNGSPSFTYGATFDGKAVWDILTANTINADLIKAGSIKSLSTAKVQTEINLDTGEATFDGDDVVLGIKGTETESNGVVFPEGMWLQSKYEDSQWIYTLSHGMRYFTKEYFVALARYQLGLTVTKPTDPYYSEVLEQSIKTKDIHCKNIYIAGTDGNEYNLLDELTLMAEEANSLRESLTALQEKYLALEEALGQQHEHTASTAVRENVVSATCTTQGSYDEVVYCATCPEEISRTKKYTDKLEHSYTSSITKQPTCTEQGTRKYTCSGCGGSYTETIAALGHNYVAVVTPPTETAQGYTTHTCSRCGDKYIDSYTDATGCQHSTTGVRYETTKEATCTVAGSRNKITYCTKCSTIISTVTEAIAATGHAYGAVSVVEPTCTEQGYSKETCLICGYVNKKNYTAATGHNDGNGDGYCDVCGTMTGEFHTLTLNVEPSGGGTVEGAGSYLSGKSVQIKATENSGYDFVAWTESGTTISTSATTTVTLNKSRTLIANFEKEMKILVEGVETSVELPVAKEKERFKFVPQYSGRYTFESLNLADLDPDVYLYASDKTTQLTSHTALGAFALSYDLVAGTAYYVDVKLHTGTGTLKFKVTKNAEKATITVGAYPEGSGTVTGGGTYSIGMSAKLTATAIEGYTFKNWDDGNTDNPRYITVETDLILVANFASDSSGGGTILNDGDTITEGVETLVNVTQTQKRVFLKFVPQRTGSYTFKSLNLADFDPDCQIYASDKTTMLDNQAASGAFSLSYNFTAGTTYWLAVLMYKGTGTLKVKIS